jgi:transporter family-2 protein
MWVGGLMGFTVVSSITFAQPRIGATAVIGILIAGQLVMGAIIDRFGWFGVEQIGISPYRALGVVLLGIGAALSLVR